MDDKKLFTDVVFEIWKDEKDFDSLAFAMNKAYDIFLREVTKFKRFDIKTKYHICLTSCLISIQSMTNQIEAVSIFKKGDIKQRKYSLYFRKEDEPEILQLHSKKPLYG